MGFFAADALTGSSLTKDVLLNAANLSGVAVGLDLPPRRPLHEPAADHLNPVLYMLMAIVGASAMSSLLGAVAMIPTCSTTQP